MFLCVFFEPPQNHSRTCLNRGHYITNPNNALLRGNPSNLTKDLHCWIPPQQLGHLMIPGKKKNSSIQNTRSVWIHQTPLKPPPPPNAFNQLIHNPNVNVNVFLPSEKRKTTRTTRGYHQLPRGANVPSKPGMWRYVSTPVVEMLAW